MRRSFLLKPSAAPRKTEEPLAFASVTTVPAGQTSEHKRGAKREREVAGPSPPPPQKPCRRRAEVDRKDPFRFVSPWVPDTFRRYCARLDECFRQRGLILLRGPVGCGKFTFVQMMARHAKLKVKRVPFGSDLSQQSRLENTIAMAISCEEDTVIVLTHVEQVPKAFKQLRSIAMDSSVSWRHPVVCTTDEFYHSEWGHLCRVNSSKLDEVINFPSAADLQKTVMQTLVSRNPSCEVANLKPFGSDVRSLVRLLQYGSSAKVVSEVLEDRYKYCGAVLRGQRPAPNTGIPIDMVLYNARDMRNICMMLFVLTNRTPLSKRLMITKLVKAEYVGRMHAVPSVPTTNAKNMNTVRPPAMGRSHYVNFAQCKGLHRHLITSYEMNVHRVKLSEGRIKKDKLERLMSRRSYQKAAHVKLGSSGDLARCVGWLT